MILSPSELIQHIKNVYGLSFFISVNKICLFLNILVHRANLSNILVVIKSLGMGFHLPVDGVHSLSLVRHLLVFIKISFLFGIF